MIISLGSMTEATTFLIKKYRMIFAEITKGDRLRGGEKSRRRQLEKYGLISQSECHIERESVKAEERN